MVAQIGVAFFGHNLVQIFERWPFPVLAIIFAIASVVILTKAAPGRRTSAGVPGGFLITFGAAFGYAAGWNPYATDYTRYLPPGTNRRATGLWAGLGRLRLLRRARDRRRGLGDHHRRRQVRDNPTGQLHQPPADRGWPTSRCWPSRSARSAPTRINVYSGSMSFLALGIKLPLSLRRAIVALVFGVGRLLPGPGPACTTPARSTRTSC